VPHRSLSSSTRLLPSLAPSTPLCESEANVPWFLTFPLSSSSSQFSLLFPCYGYGWTLSMRSMWSLFINTLPLPFLGSPSACWFVPCCSHARLLSTAVACPCYVRMGSHEVFYPFPFAVSSHRAAVWILPLLVKGNQCGMCVSYFFPRPGWLVRGLLQSRSSPDHPPGHRQSLVADD